MSVSLKVEGISKIYDKTIALENINLEIGQGEFICLLGPSGCGKSTLLRLIAGLDTPNKGKIYINGKDVTGLPPAKRNFGIMFQSYALFPNLTAFDNVAYGLKNKKMRRQDITERVDRLFEMIHLPEAKMKYPSQLSGGEQQRVALARALATEPDFLLLDEPLSALDAKVRISLRAQICAIQKELGLTTIMVTHDQDEALTMADRIIVMNKATVMQSGTPEEIYHKPETPFVADFIGSINFLKNSETTKNNTEKTIRAIRPEKIEVSRKMTPNAIHGEITYIEFRGSIYRLTVKLHNLLAPETVNVDVPFNQVKAMKLAVGDDVYVRLPEEELLIF